MPKAKEAPDSGKTTVRPDTSKYETARSASGAKSQHNGDAVATALQGATLDEVYDLAAEAIGDTTVKDLKAKYGHLNDGMQRMNLGNRMRGVAGKMNKEKEGSGDTYITKLSSAVRKAVAGREKEREQEKAAKAKEAAAKAKAKERAKAKK